MTREELENVMWRAGLTSQQVADIMPAINAYATAQAAAGIKIDAPLYWPQKGTRT